MINAESQPFPISGELADAVATIAADGLLAEPIHVVGAGGAVAVVISTELLAILQRALDGAAHDAPPLSQLADSLGLDVTADGTIGVSHG